MDDAVPRKKKRGPPATGKGALIGVRFQRSMLVSIDAWIAAQPEPKPSRPEAIRRFVFEAAVARAVDERTAKLRDEMKGLSPARP